MANSLSTRGAFWRPLGYALSGFALFLAAWYVLVDVLALWRFSFMPPLLLITEQLFSTDPIYGISLLTPELYEHMGVSLVRVYGAFAMAVLIGGPLGILMAGAGAYAICCFRWWRFCARFRLWRGCRGRC